MKNGKKVLFSGTPCQVAAFKSYLGQDYENLFTLDFVCGGVPGAFFFDRWLQQSDQKITAVNFRVDDGSSRRNIEYVYENGEKKRVSTDKDCYLQAFWLNLTQMESCFHCPFSDLSRCSDCTLGDFWGVEKASHVFSKGDGVSLVLVNTEKGKALFEGLSEVKTEMHSLQTAANGNPRLLFPLKKNPKAGLFAKQLERNGFEYAFQRVTHKTFGERVFAKAKRVMRSMRKK